MATFDNFLIGFISGLVVAFVIDTFLIIEFAYLLESK